MSRHAPWQSLLPVVEGWGLNTWRWHNLWASLVKEGPGLGAVLHCAALKEKGAQAVVPPCMPDFCWPGEGAGGTHLKWSAKLRKPEAIWRCLSMGSWASCRVATSSIVQPMALQGSAGDGAFCLPVHTAGL